MGIVCPNIEMQYSVFCSNKKEGETPVLRHPLMADKGLLK